MLLEVLNDAAEGTVFGFSCVLDGVRAVESGSQKGRLELYYVNDNQKVLLNNPKQEELHNLFKECATSISCRSFR